MMMIITIIMIVLVMTCYYCKHIDEGIDHSFEGFGSRGSTIKDCL